MATTLPLSRRGASILVVDDEEIMREILETLLTREGYQVRLVSSGEEGLELARTHTFDAAIVDVMMPGLDGIATLQELRKLDDDLPVLMITAFASVETAISAMKLGAFDYITKPFKNDEVLVVVRNAVERRQLVAENTALKQTLQAQYRRFAGIIGGSPRMKQVFDLILQAAPSRSTILVTGESGTGKELVARAIHSNSPRAERAFVTVNSGNLPSDLLESTLFGHVKGGIHRGDQSEEGSLRSRRQGQHFLRRDREHSPGNTGQAVARHAGARVHAPRRNRYHQGRCPHHRRHQL
jgi:DNA-binding NtrC family response regulator